MTQAQFISRRSVAPVVALPFKSTFQMRLGGSNTEGILSLLEKNKVLATQEAQNLARVVKYRLDAVDETFVIVQVSQLGFDRVASLQHVVQAALRFPGLTKCHQETGLYFATQLQGFAGECITVVSPPIEDHRHDRYVWAVSQKSGCPTELKIHLGSAHIPLHPSRRLLFKVM